MSYAWESKNPGDLVVPGIVPGFSPSIQGGFLGGKTRFAGSNCEASRWFDSVWWIP